MQAVTPTDTPGLLGNTCKNYFYLFPCVCTPWSVRVIPYSYSWGVDMDIEASDVFLPQYREFSMIHWLKSDDIG